MIAKEEVNLNLEKLAERKQREFQEKCESCPHRPIRFGPPCSDCVQAEQIILDEIEEAKAELKACDGESFDDDWWQKHESILADLASMGLGEVCISCGEVFFGKYGTDFYGEIVDKGFLCEGCMESDESNANTWVFGENGERITWHVGDYLATRVELCERISREQWEAEEGFSQVYHKTDAWRGHYITSSGDKWTKVIDDWLGIVDGHNIGKNRLGAFHDLWQVQEQNPPFDIVVAFPRGSNVCACGIDVYVPADKEDEFEDWLKQSEQYEDDR